MLSSRREPPRAVLSVMGGRKLGFENVLLRGLFYLCIVCSIVAWEEVLYYPARGFLFGFINCDWYSLDEGYGTSRGEVVLSLLLFFLSFPFLFHRRACMYGMHI